MNQNFGTSHSQQQAGQKLPGLTNDMLQLATLISEAEGIAREEFLRKLRGGDVVDLFPNADAKLDIEDE